METPKKTWLVELNAYNPDTQAEESFYFTISSLTPFSSADDDRADQYYEPRLRVPANIARYLFSKGKISGSSTINKGSVELANPDGKLDFLYNYGLDGRKITILYGEIGKEFKDFQVILTGVMQVPNFVWNKRGSYIELRVRDRQAEITDKEIQTNLFDGSNSGTAGIEGTADDLKDKVKPLCYGQCYNVPAFCVNYSSNIYQLHDGSIEEITTVYDKGVVLTSEGDVADLTTLQNATISGGCYKTCLAEGIFRLAAEPSGTVTVDCKGDNAGSSYVSSVADIVERILTNQASLTSSDIDETAFTALNTANNAPVGIFISKNRTVGSVLDDLVNSIGAYWTSNEDHKFTVGRIEEPDTTAIKEWVKDDLIDIERVLNNAPAYQVQLSYKPVWKTQSDSDLADSVTASHKNYVAEEYRVATQTDESVLTAHPLAEVFYKKTLLANQSDAEAEALRLLNILKIQRELLRIVVPLTEEQEARTLASTVKLTLPRYNLSSGKNYVVTGVAAGVPKQSNLTIEMWG